MAILDKLFTFGRAIFNRDVYLGESGQPVYGDKKAVDGNTVSNSLLNEYKEIMYFATDYNKVLPIKIDQVVKNTRKIIIRAVPDAGNTYVPRYIQLYDPDNWIASNIKSTNTLDIYLILMYSYRYTINDSKDIKTYGEIRSDLGTINVIVETNSNNISNVGTIKFSRASEYKRSQLVHVEIGSSSFTVTYYPDYKSVIQANLSNLL